MDNVTNVGGFIARWQPWCLVVDPNGFLYFGRMHFRTIGSHFNSHVFPYNIERFPCWTRRMVLVTNLFYELLKPRKVIMFSVYKNNMDLLLYRLRLCRRALVILWSEYCAILGPQDSLKPRKALIAKYCAIHGPQNSLQPINPTVQVLRNTWTIGPMCFSTKISWLHPTPLRTGHLIWWPVPAESADWPSNEMACPQRGGA
jgi:hypothetical protein